MSEINHKLLMKDMSYVASLPFKSILSAVSSSSAEDGNEKIIDAITDYYSKLVYYLNSELEKERSENANLKSALETKTADYDFLIQVGFSNEELKSALAAEMVMIGKLNSKLETEKAFVVDLNSKLESKAEVIEKLRLALENRPTKKDETTSRALWEEQVTINQDLRTTLQKQYHDIRVLKIELNTIKGNETKFENQKKYNDELNAEIERLYAIIETRELEKGC